MDAVKVEKPVSEILFNQEEQAQIINAIREAEKNTSGEIKVHVEKHCEHEDVLERAKEVFLKLSLHETKLRNSVLFYLALDNQKFAILGDAGIHEIVGEDFWHEIKNHCINHFKDNRFIEGLTEGINLAGEQLKKHFPYQNGDINEISDDISFGKN